MADPELKANHLLGGVGGHQMEGPNAKQKAINMNFSGGKPRYVNYTGMLGIFLVKNRGMLNIQGYYDFFL